MTSSHGRNRPGPNRYSVVEIERGWFFNSGVRTEDRTSKFQGWHSTPPTEFAAMRLYGVAQPKVITLLTYGYLRLLQA